MDNKKELISRIAHLESKVDMLEAELVYLNQILIQSGFPEGIKTLKSTVEEVLLENHSLSSGDL